MKHLIVNADDFGLSSGVNRGIVEAHRNGIVTSTSLMVRQPAADEAIDLARANPRLSIGLHFDIGEWYRDDDGNWKSLYAFADRDDVAAVRTELLSQLTRFRNLLGRNPTHLDSHQHVHRSVGPARDLLIRAGQALDIPVRHFSRTVQYCGDFYATDGATDAISVENLIRTIMSLTGGVTELCCHPGDDETLATKYRSERRLELAALTDPRLRDALATANVTLHSFATFPRPQNRSEISPQWLQKLGRFLVRGLDA